ncbi:MAG TPA: O-antigen ligase family protein [Actinobacteria bacterium]|nr:O-antigen ligase family protein [Actinomycetota bacterium]
MDNKEITINFKEGSFLGKIRSFFSSANINFVYIFIALLAVFLLVNKYPYMIIAVLGILTLISFIALCMNHKINIIGFKLNIFLFIIYFYFLLSFLVSEQSLTSFLNFNFLRYDGSFFFCYLPFFVFSIIFLNYRKALKIYFYFLFSTFVLFAVFGFIEYSNFLQSVMVKIDDYYVGLMFVALNNAHNATGSVYAIVSVFALSFFLKGNKKEKIAYGAVLALCFIALLITKSRGSLLAFLGGAVFVFLLSSKSVLKFLRNFFLMGVLIVPVILLTDTLDRIKMIFYAKDLSTLTRISLWEKAITLFKQSPVIGIGYGRYNDVLWHFDSLRLTGKPGIAAMYTQQNFAFNDTNAHSSYFHFLAETGIIGLVLILIFWISCFTIIFKAYRTSNNSFNLKAYLSVLGGILTLFLLSFTENYMTAPTVMFCISVVVALSIGLCWQERKENHSEETSL